MAPIAATPIPDKGMGFATDDRLGRIPAQRLMLSLFAKGHRFFMKHKKGGSTAALFNNSA
jgi:hypothetical protein